MRIRQVKPSFWTDATIARASYQARLFYIGLWNVADDAGYIEWQPLEIGALLFPYESPKMRERHISSWTEELTASGRLIVKECGCAVIPTLPSHQRIAGKQAFTVRDKHDRLHRGRIPPGSIRGVSEGETVTSRAQTGPNSRTTEPSDKQAVAASGYQVLTDSPGNGTVGNVTVGNGSAGARDVSDKDDDATSDFRRLVPRPGAAGVH
jgi:hypothetical protein